MFVSKLSFLSLLFMFSMVKFIIQRNHLLNYLILIEVYMILMYFSLSFLTNTLSSTLVSIFFMVIMVCGASLGMSLLVMITRNLNKELEITHSTFNLK